MALKKADVSARESTTRSTAIYFGAKSNAPDTSAGVEEIGQVSFDFTSVDMAGFEKKNLKEGRGKVKYKVEYEVNVDFRSDVGVLRCFCTSRGKTIGATSLHFSDLTT
ncbi:hypothetical protein B0T25DRAFT_561503 [Lasiosphaeria hispida]|uniref:Uncharacterized protein n=1 Tax=Lasiosphaeria hispida TaxID=260671 RepID=A0AAJ0MJF2_9PEZI|nr:hypothetical protein B0T25DRAFT_561503 [Lasiosphaeria hispida]